MAAMHIVTERGHGAQGEKLIPVFFDFSAEDPNDFQQDPAGIVFVGISYGSTSKRHPVLSVATGGVVSVPHNSQNFRALMGHRVNWSAGKYAYGTEDGPKIVVPADGRTGAAIRGLCRCWVQFATPRDCTIILG